MASTAKQMQEKSLLMLGLVCSHKHSAFIAIERDRETVIDTITERRNPNSRVVCVPSDDFVQSASEIVANMQLSNDFTVSELITCAITSLCAGGDRYFYLLVACMSSNYATKALAGTEITVAPRRGFERVLSQKDLVHYAALLRCCIEHASFFVQHTTYNSCSNIFLRECGDRAVLSAQQYSHYTDVNEKKCAKFLELAGGIVGLVETVPHLEAELLLVLDR